MTEPNVTPSVPANGVAPPSDPDASKYEELRKQLGIEAEPAEPTESEPKEPAEGAEPAAEPEQREHVPFVEHENVQKALREAREQAKAADARFQQFLQIVQESAKRAPAEPKKDAPKAPDKLEDPIGYYDAQLAEIRALMQQQAQGSQHTSQQFQAWQQQQAIHAAVQAADADIRDQRSPNHKPDYDEACDYIRGVRVKQLELMYPDTPQVQQYAHSQGFRSVAELRQQMLNGDEMAVAMQALQTGMSPSLQYYNLAVAAGFQPKTSKPNGVDAKAKIEAAKRGRTASVSISGGGGGKGVENMGIAELTELFKTEPDRAREIMKRMGSQGLLG